MVQVKEKDGYVHTYTDYSSEFVKKAKELHGKWTGESWKFKLEDKELVKKALEEVYGENGYDVVAKVRVRVDAYKLEQAKYSNCYPDLLSLFGRTLVRRTGRDSDVKVSTDVYVVEGTFPSSGGSVKNPRLYTPEGLMLEVKNVPLEKANEEIARYGDCIQIIAEEKPEEKIVELAIDTTPKTKEEMLNNIINAINTLIENEDSDNKSEKLIKMKNYISAIYDMDF